MEFHNLFKAIASLNSKDEVEHFIKDLCTPSEIENFVERWNTAQLLTKTELSYRAIASEYGISTTTIGRVGRVLKYENNGGYKSSINRLDENE